MPDLLNISSLLTSAILIGVLIWEYRKSRASFVEWLGLAIVLTLIAEFFVRHRLLGEVRSAGVALLCSASFVGLLAIGLKLFDRITPRSDAESRAIRR